MTASPCPGCGAVLGETLDIATRHDGVASAACRAGYERVLTDLYSTPQLLGLRQLAVDAYAVQHPAPHGRVADQSLGLHLMTLYLFVEKAVDPARGPALHKQMVARRPAFHPLDPPTNRGSVTVAAVPAGSEPSFATTLHKWAREAWTAWSPHHDVVRRWLRQAGCH